MRRCKAPFTMASMTRGPVRTAVVALAALTLVGAALGAALNEGRWAAAAHGAAIGIATGLAAVIHFGARTLAARTADATGSKFSADSVERRAFQEALADVAPDALGLMSLSTLLCLVIPDLVTVRLVLVGVLILVVGDLVVRVRLRWRASVSDDA